MVKKDQFVWLMERYDAKVCSLAYYQAQCKTLQMKVDELNKRVLELESKVPKPSLEEAIKQLRENDSKMDRIEMVKMVHQLTNRDLSECLEAVNKEWYG